MPQLQRGSAGKETAAAVGRPRVESRVATAAGSGRRRAAAAPEASLAQGDGRSVAIHLHGHPLPRSGGQQLLVVPRRGGRRRRGPQARRHDGCGGRHDACRDAGPASCEGAARVAARRGRRRVVAPARPAEGVGSGGGWAAAAAGGGGRGGGGPGSSAACVALLAHCWCCWARLWKATTACPQPSPSPPRSLGCCLQGHHPGAAGALPPIQRRAGHARARLAHPLHHAGPLVPQNGNLAGTLLVGHGWNAPGRAGGGPRSVYAPLAPPPCSAWPPAAPLAVLACSAHVSLAVTLASRTTIKQTQGDAGMNT